MRIAQLISSNGLYGAEGMVLTLSSALRNLDCDVRIVLFNAGRESVRSFEQEAQRRSIPLVSLTCHSRCSPGAVKRLARYLTVTGIDVLHTHGYKADIYGYLSTRLCATQPIATCHNWTDRTTSLRRYGNLDKWVLGRFPIVAAVSADVRNSLAASGVPLRNLHLVPNGVETARFSDSNPGSQTTGAMRLGVLSRLSIEKGVDVLLHALAEIIKTQPHVTCAIGGDGPERESLQTLAANLNLSKHINFMGFQSDAGAFFQECDIVVHPSRKDAMPLALLEAMACAKPVVASAVGEIPSLLGHQDAGLLVPPDDVPALAQSILTLIENEAFRNRLGAAAQLRVQAEFDASTMAENYLALYRRAALHRAPHTESHRLDIEEAR